MDPIVAVTGLKKSFGSVDVLNGIDFGMAKGEVAVILGASGSGKTTLLRSINVLATPSEGSVEVCGLRVRFAPGLAPTRGDRKTIQDIRLKTAMVFQSFNLFPNKTALGNVVEGLVSVRGVTKREAAARGMALLEQMGLGGKAHEYPSRLSGGQKQRVASARGLAMEPEIMLFDEPTSALDPELRNEVLASMRQLAAKGMTMLLVTHELSFARDVASRILFIDRGTVAADLPPATFFSKPSSERIEKFLANVR